MTQEEKYLLIKDLSARLLYKVKFSFNLWDEEKQEEVNAVCTIYSVNTDGYCEALEESGHIPLDSVKPYLRLIRSMTEEERDEYIRMLCKVGFTEFYKTADKILDFLYKRHFDVHGLIPKGMAIEVTPENNPYKA